MSRDKIKIIEFGMDEDSPSAAGPAGEKTIKIIEFDNDAGDSGKRIATAKDVGHIKIVEFNDDLKTGKTPAPEGRRSSVGPVKIKEFNEDKEPQAPASPSRAPKIKIMEFD